MGTSSSSNVGTYRAGSSFNRLDERGGDGVTADDAAALDLGFFGVVGCLPPPASVRRDADALIFFLASNRPRLARRSALRLIPMSMQSLFDTSGAPISFFSSPSRFFSMVLCRLENFEASSTERFESYIDKGGAHD